MKLLSGNQRSGGGGVNIFFIWGATQFLFSYKFPEIATSFAKLHKNFQELQKVAGNKNNHRKNRVILQITEERAQAWEEICPSFYSLRLCKALCFTWKVIKTKVIVQFAGHDDQILSKCTTCDPPPPSSKFQNILLIVWYYKISFHSQVKDQSMDGSY